MKHAQFTISLADAVLIRQAFLPSNPNKLRSADKRVVEAAKRYITEIHRLAALSVISETESNDELQELRDRRDLALRDGNRKLAMQLAVQIDKKRNRY